MKIYRSIFHDHLYLTALKDWPKFKDWAEENQVKIEISEGRVPANKYFRIIENEELFLLRWM